MPKIDFTGRVAIVTGGGAGLGRDYAIELAKRGAKVLVNDLGGGRNGCGSSEAAANQVVSEIKAIGGEAVPNYDTVATVDGGENVFRMAIDAFGKVDILINNAGILRDKTFANMEEEDWDAVLNVHLKGAYCVTRPAFIHMRKNGYGRIVMTASMSGLIGNFGQTNYGAAKMGIVGLTNVLKLEGAKYNIKVNVLLPSAVTRLSEDVMAEENFKKFKVECCTPALLYLASEQCRDSGACIHAFAGYISRSAILTGPGITFSDIPTPEQIMKSWDKIMSLKGAKFYDNANEMVTNLMGSAIGLQ